MIARKNIGFSRHFGVAATIALALSATHVAAQPAATAIKLDLKCDVVESRNGKQKPVQFSLKIRIDAGAEVGEYHLPGGVIPEGPAFLFVNKVKASGYLLDLTDMSISKRHNHAIGSPTISTGSCKPAGR